MKWEYANKRLLSDSHKTLNETLRDVDDANCATLSKFGSEDWELVSVDNGIAYFKRAISRDISEFKSVMVWRTMTPEEIADRDKKRE